MSWDGDALDPPSQSEKVEDLAQSYRKILPPKGVIIRDETLA